MIDEINEIGLVYARESKDVLIFVDLFNHPIL